MRTFIKNYLHFIKNCIRPPVKKLKSLKSGFIKNSNFENNRVPWSAIICVSYTLNSFCDVDLRPSWTTVDGASHTAAVGRLIHLRPALYSIWSNTKMK